MEKDKMICATIFDIERGSTVDGPGIRTTVFFKGCNLRCRWCHNPESQAFGPQLMFYRNKCTGCGKCREVCPYHLENCVLCGKCELFCPHDARMLCGRKYTVEEVLKQVASDKAFYDNSGGGVTFSGGECMLQLDFLTETAKKCQEAGIHTAVDTAGNVPWESFERIMPYTDIFLYDMKCFSEELHRENTGVSNRLILENLKKLSGRAEIVVRIPIIPSVNDGEEELAKMADFLRALDVPPVVELLPYHRLGEGKCDALGMKCTEYPVPDKKKMQEYREVFDIVRHDEGM